MFIFTFNVTGKFIINPHKYLLFSQYDFCKLIGHSITCSHSAWWYLNLSKDVVSTCHSVSSRHQWVFLYLGTGHCSKAMFSEWPFNNFICVKLCFIDHLLNSPYNLCLFVITFYLYIFLFNFFFQKLHVWVCVCMPECRYTKRSEKSIRLPGNCALSHHM